MAKDAPDMGAALAAAFEGSGSMAETTEEGTGAEAPEATEAAPSTEGSTSAQAEVESTSETGTQTEATEAAAPEGTEEVPDRYFEVDLSSLPAEERTQVIAALKERDDAIGRLLRGKAEEGAPAEGETQGEAEPSEPLTDEAILQALGLDPESNPFQEETAKVAVPLVRGMQQLQEQVASLIEANELQALEYEWTSTLDRLSSENGELPVTREAVIDFAASNGITSPEDAYWRIFGPARRQVEQAVAAAQGRITAAEKKPVDKGAASSQRPVSGAAEAEVTLKGKTAREATAEAAKRVLNELGIG